MTLTDQDIREIADPVEISRQAVEAFEEHSGIDLTGLKGEHIRIAARLIIQHAIRTGLVRQSLGD